MLYLLQNQIPLCLCLNFSSLVFLIGLIGIIWNMQNLLILLIFIEIMFLGLNTQLIFLAVFTNQPIGYVYALINLLLAAVESVVGLTIVILCFRVNNSIQYESLTNLRY